MKSPRPFSCRGALRALCLLVALAFASAPQAEPDDTIATKARELTAGSKTELEKIQAIGRYVQNIHYISIQIGLNRGGGMQPHRDHPRRKVRRRASLLRSRPRERRRADCFGAEVRGRDGNGSQPLKAAEEQ
ncbi:MAG TPA: hypothetical protein VEX60_11320 [Pyrinomonadaceae bacterium]|nr:hypothetical protein [Pyrinomonadaceae bacterium]